MRAEARHTAGLAATLQRVDARLEKLASTVATLRESGCEPAVSQSLMALTSDIQRSRKVLGELTENPSIAADAGAIKSAHDAAKDLEQITKALENLMKNLDRVADRGANAGE